MVTAMIPGVPAAGHLSSGGYWHPGDADGCTKCAPPERRWELKLATGKVVEWDGTSGEDAARRYVDCHREAAVVASREADRHGIFVLGRAGRIHG